MTKAMMALEAEKAELARMVLDLDDMELVKKAKAALKQGRPFLHEPGES